MELLTEAAPPAAAPQPADAVIEAANQVIEARDIRTLFQPLLHLRTGDVVGFEALTRGPQGSPVESPLALLEAARAAGRLAELDWLCAASACDAAVSAKLHPSASLFLNFDPATLLTPCPEDLLRSTRRAQDQLRIFVEMNEESLIADPGRVFAALAQLRAIGWGVAIDNAFIGSSSLGVFPLIEPDVIKLDLQAAGGDPAVIAAMSDRARLASEHSGAAIHMAGLEKPEDVRLARLAGAEFGQGWLFGVPAPLPADTTAPRNVVPFTRYSEAVADELPFDLLRSLVPTAIAERSLIEPLAAYIEEQAHANGPPGILLLSFDARTPPSPDGDERLRRHVERSAFTVVLGAGPGPESTKTSIVRRLSRSDAMSTDRCVVVLGTHYAGALVARDLDEDGEPGDHRFEYAITHDRSLVCLVARAFVRRAAATPPSN